MAARIWPLVALAACGSAPAEPRVANTAVPVRVAVDADDDLVADVRDRCPGQPEDHDFFEDDDGCPEPDNDRDGIEDETDLCPYTHGGSRRGCPEGCVIVVDTYDCFLSPLFFFDGPEDRQLASIVTELAAHPDIREVTLSLARHQREPERAARARLERLVGKLVARGVAKARLAIELQGDTGDLRLSRTVYGRVTRQRFAEGRFRAAECTAFGAIYKPARPQYRCPGAALPAPP